MFWEEGCGCEGAGDDDGGGVLYEAPSWSEMFAVFGAFSYVLGFF